MKKSVKRILTIVLSIMIIMTYMIPGSVFAGTALDLNETANAEIQEPDQANEELSKGADDSDVVISDDEDPPVESEGEIIEEVPEAIEAEEPAEEVTEEPAEELPAAEETVTINDTAKAAAEEVPAVKAGTGGLSVLAFTSDTHNTSGNSAANRLGTWLDKMADIYGAVDVMAFGGDMAGAGASGYWDLTQADMNKVSERNITPVYTTGNHEISYGGDFSYSTYTSGGYSKTETKGQFEINKEVVNGSNYRVYALGSTSGSQSYANSISSLTSYLNSAGNTKPIFIITHFPLHWTSSRTTTSAGEVINVLNNAAENNGQKIVFLWGHNHTEAANGSVETHYDEIFAPGETIQYANGSRAELKFYYAAAGCMSDGDYGSGSGAVKGKGLVVTINSKNQLSFAYHNASGTNVTEDGTDGQGTAFTEQDPVYAESMSLSAQTATVEVGRTLKPKLEVSFLPEDTNFKSVTWSSSNPSAASVDSTGKVKGISQGTTVITATYALEGSSLSASCTVEVVPRTTSDPEYVIRIGDYALSTEHSTDSYSSGNGYFGGSTYNGMVAVPYTAGSGADDEIRWTLEEADDGNGYYIKSSDDRYLNATYESSGSSWMVSSTSDLKLDDTPDVWTFDGDLEDWLVDGSKLKSANTDRYLAEVTGSAGTHIITTRSSDSAATTIGELASDPVAVTGVSVTPATATVEARKSVPFTANVTPADATNKKVTWSSSDTSVATVDANGKVRGVAPGTATITAASVDNPGITATGTVTVTQSTSTEQHYVIMVDGNALTTERSPNTANGGSSSYTYTGLAGAPLTSAADADDNMRFIFEETEGGYYIMDLEGNYLNATYTSGNNSGQGNLKLDSTKDVWALDSGYSLESGTVDGSKLKSTNASGTATSDKFLSYEDSANLFSVRSSGNADEITIEEAEDPVAVTGVTVSPKTVSIEAKKTTTLTATVAPENATNKKVTWSSSDTSVATVDENGKVKGVAAGTATITATTADGGKKDTCAVTVTPSTVTEKHYVIEIDGFALSKDRSPNTANGGSSSYTYTGLAGVAYTAGEDPDDNISWIIEETEGGYYIKDLEGNYLNATYTSGSNSGKGDLKLDSTPDVWSIEGTLEDWMVDGSKLKSANASGTATSDKFLGYENNENLFTVRSNDNADESTLVDPSITIEERFVETDTLEDGKEYIIAVTKDNGSVYAIKNTAGTGTGNTGSATLTVTPASGSDPAYIETDDVDVVWKYQSSNQYMLASTGSNHYLGYEQSTYKPRTSSSGRAIIYSGGKLQITSGHYLTCDGGTFDTSTSSSSGATVRLFVKSIVIVECDHEYGEPTWSWTGNVKSRAVVTATATFTCTKCGEQLEVPADVASTTDSSGHVVYTATVTGPDGKTYTDTKNAAEDGKYTVTITADKTEVTPGDEVTFTITLGPVDKFGSFQMTTVIPEGLTYVAGSFTTTGDKEALRKALGFDDVDWTEETMRFTGFTLDEDYVSTEDTVLATFKCTVDSGFTTSATVDMTRLEFYSSTDWTHNMTDQYEIIPATVVYTAHTHNLTSHAAVAATCEAAGNSAYWSCDGCGKFFSDAEGKTEIEQNSWVIPALGHNLTAHAAVAATCEAAGNSAYWSCDRCGKFFSDAEGKTEIEQNSWVIEALGHNFGEWTVTTAPTCTEAGVETRTCSRCETKETRAVAALGHNLTAHAAVAATCEAAGNSAYWSCDRCGKFFSDAEGKTEIAENSWVIAALGHNWKFVDFTWTGSDEEGYTAAVANYECQNDKTHKQTVTATVTSKTTAATCDTAGKTVYTATVAAKDSLDKTAHSDTKEVAIAALGHNLTAHAAVAATCEAAGNSAYWSCDRCGKFFSDAEGKTEIAENSWVIEALGHNFGEWTVTTAPTCTEAGVETRTCSRCETKETRAVAALGHNLTAHAAVAATCEAAGNSAYWSCDRCGKFFSDAEGKTEIAENSWVIAALGHNWKFVDFTWTGSDEEGYTAAIANYECQNDKTHKQTVTATVTSKETPATCEGEGAVVYTATVAAADSLDKTAHSDTKTVETEATGHEWGEPFYGWNSDNSKVTAIRKCTKDESHVESETVSTTYKVVQEPTETGSGIGLFTSGEFKNTAFEVQYKEVVLQPTGYAITYVWAEDKSTVKATADPYDTTLEPITETVETTNAVTTQPTCTVPGVKTYKATFTNQLFSEQTETEEIPVLDHNLTAHAAVAATCEAAGNSAYWSCDSCGKFFSDAEGKTEIAENSWVIPALGHNLTAHAAVTATCEAAGNSAYWSCDRCGKFFSDAEGKTEIAENSWVIAALGHNWKFVDFTWTGSDEEGYTAAVANYECQNDKTHKHTVTATVTSKTTAATCDTAGKTVYTATVAAADSLDKTAHSDTKEVAIAALGHNLTAHAAVAATCVAAGNSAYWSCDRCGKFFSDAEGKTEIAENSWVIEALGHNFGEWTVTTAPTCTEAGVETRTCSRCETKETRAVAALGHNLTAHAAVAATCEAAGNNAYWSCDRCGKFFSDAEGKTEIAENSWVIAALGHNWKFLNFTWTEDSDGYTAVASYECQNDKTHKQTVTATVTSKTTAATCDTAGKTVYTATVAAADSLDKTAHSDAKEVAVATLGHNLTAHAAVAATCEAAGNSAYWSCDRCGKFFSDAEGKTEIEQNSWVIKAIGHNWNDPVYVWSNDHTSVTATFICKNDPKHMQTVTASGDAITVKETIAPTTSAPGEKTYTAKIVFEDKIYETIDREEIPKLEGGQYMRIFGDTRYETSLKIAEELKEKLGVDKFDTVILADGRNYPDALAGSYLSNVLKAPILLVDNRQAHIDEVQKYIKANLKPDGKIYLLGGAAVVPEEAVAGLSYETKRLWGQTRYETNIEILKEAAKYDSKGSEILVCSGTVFADSLSAAATGKPILLVGKSLTQKQKEYLRTLGGNQHFTIIGGTGAVSASIKSELDYYGDSDRVWGSTRYETSVEVAKKFFGNKAKTGMLAYGVNFPDGLCGGVLANVYGGPLILTAPGKTAAAEKYGFSDMETGIMLGGPTLISDSMARDIFSMKAKDKIIVK